MAEEDRSAKIGGNADSSAIITGERNTATITITNYYYREETKVTPVESIEADDENILCPYRGLFHFGPDDAGFFFGREVFVKELFAATQTRNFIPLLGASGSGKSSVVLAGLVPKLQQEGHWLFTHFRPGSEPFHALAEALVPLYEPDKNTTEQIGQARQLADFFMNGFVPLQDVFSKIQRNYPNHRVLLIADQFEELYTLCSDHKIRHSFLDTLLACFKFSHDNTAVLVATMRADFLGNALSYRPVADVLQNADIKLGPMNHEELFQVIVKPGEKLGVSFEAGLVERILDDVEDEPGNLPLLEFALTELWKRRKGKQLTHAAYEEIGEVQGALAYHADKNYCKLSQAEQEQVRRIFIQLVRPGEGTEDTRRLATKAELSEASWGLVKQLADARLVVTSRNAAEQETVEVVHEALIHNWVELRQWMNAARSFRAWQDRLRAAMYQWEQTQRDDGALLQGVALAEAEEKLKERRDDLSKGEREFIEVSVEHRNLLLKEEEEHKQRELKLARRIAIGATVAFLFMAGLSILAFFQWQQSQKNSIIALTLNAEARLRSNQQLEAIIEAIRAGKQFSKTLIKEPDVSTQIITTLEEIFSNVNLKNRLEGHTNSVTSIVFSSDGKTIASASYDNTVKLWKRDGEKLKTLTEYNSGSIVFSPDIKTIAFASGDHDKIVKLWSQSHQVLTILRGHTAKVNSVILSPNGDIIATASDDKTVKLWNRQGQLRHTLTGHNAKVNSVVFSPNGDIIATASDDKTVKLWNRQGQLRHTLTGHNAKVNSVVFSPNGDIIATASDDKTVKLWNRQGQLRHTLTGHRGTIMFSPDGKTIAFANSDSTVKLWNLKEEKLSTTLTGHTSGVNSVIFSPNGDTIATASDDKTVKLWNRQGQLRQTLIADDIQPIASMAFSPDGKILATATSHIQLWSLNNKARSTLESKNFNFKIKDYPYNVVSTAIVKGLSQQLIDQINLINPDTLVSFKELNVDFFEGAWLYLQPPAKQALQRAIQDRGQTMRVNSAYRTIAQQMLLYNDRFNYSNRVARPGASNHQTGLAIDIEDPRGWEPYLMQYGWNPLPGDPPHFDYQGDGTIDLRSQSMLAFQKLWNKNNPYNQIVENGIYGWKTENSLNSSYINGFRIAPSDEKSNIIKKDLKDIDDLLTGGCNWVRDYLRNNPNVSDEDRQLCDGVGKKK